MARALYTRRLDSGVKPAAAVGRRGATLSRLHSLGLPVPPAFAIGAAAFRSWQAAGGTPPPDFSRELSRRLDELGTGGVLRVRPSPLGTANPTGGASAQTVERDQVMPALEAVWRAHPDAPVTVQRLPRDGGEQSGHGLFVSRDPLTGSPGPTIRFRVGERGPKDLRRDLPAAHEALEAAASLLETVFCDMCAIEFMIDRRELWLLDAFAPQRSGPAAVRVAVEMVDEALLSVHAALRRIPLWAFEQAQAPVFAHPQEIERICPARPLAPGAAVGGAVFEPQEADRRAAAGEPVVLVAAAQEAERAVTQWAPSAVVVAGPMEMDVFPTRPAVCHAPELVVDRQRRHARAASGRLLHAGQPVSVDGRAGLVAAGEVRLVAAQPDPHVAYVLPWCDELRQLTVAGIAPSSWSRVSTVEAARAVSGAPALIDPGGAVDGAARDELLRELVAAALKAGSSELGIIIPSPLGGWDLHPPPAPWRLVVAQPGLEWAARLLAARTPCDGAGADASQLPSAHRWASA